MNFSIQLPKKNGQIEEKKFDNNSLIIIGANGAGKSRLGAWIENKDLDNIHRVGAQRSLEFKEYVELKSYKQAENELLTGYEKLDKSKGYRWQWGKQTTALLKDFDAVLSALIAKKNLENDKYIEEHALTVNINRLRSKIEDNPSKPKYIKTIYGIGYTWAGDNC